MENKILIVLGMHRSGTSLTAQWLHKNGLNMGDVLLRGDFSNEDGHYEDQEILNFNKDLLYINKQKVNGLHLTQDLIFTEYFKKRLLNLVHFKNSLHQQWAFKEPRTCLFAKEYFSLIPHAKGLIIYRSLQEVVFSLLRRDVERFVIFSKSNGKIAKLGFYLMARKQIKGIVERNFNDYINAWFVYNKAILNVLNDDSSRFIVVSLANFIEKEDLIYSKLTNWGFVLSNVKTSSFYKKEKLNKKNVYFDKLNIKIEDEILQKAFCIEEEFSKFLIR